MRKLNKIMLLTLVGVFALGLSAYALPTEVVNLGDTTVESVNDRYSSGYKKESLSYWFEQNGITNTDGSAVDPVADQSQDELFYTDTARTYEIEFLGIGYADYHSSFGVFTYSGNPYEEFDSSKITYQDPLFIQNETPDNSTFSFDVEADTYFGFYVDSNQGGTKLTTMNSANSDGVDHTLFFETNKGYTMAFEDIIGGGDRDYEDLVVNFNPVDDSGFTDGGAAVPEPSTIILLSLGVLGLLGIGRKKFQR
jgi:hypothetical protein